MRMMRRWFCGALLLCLSLAVARADNESETREVLDKTAARMTESGGVKMAFKTDNFVDGELKGSIEGTMCIDDAKFRVETPQMITWYNGAIQWTYMAESEEVNVSMPKPTEQLSMNPTKIIHLYRNGYSYKMKETSLNGKACYEVTLIAEDKKRTPYVAILNIEKGSYNPMCIRLRMSEKKEWLRIAIREFSTGVKYAKSDFEFYISDYPNAEVIDLR